MTGVQLACVSWSKQQCRYSAAEQHMAQHFISTCTQVYMYANLSAAHLMNEHTRSVAASEFIARIQQMLCGSGVQRI
jgi:hypothetical protein